jgi:hypothetical protein
LPIAGIRIVSWRSAVVLDGARFVRSVAGLGLVDPVVGTPPVLPPFLAARRERAIVASVHGGGFSAHLCDDGCVRIVRWASRLRAGVVFLYIHFGFCFFLVF